MRANKESKSLKTGRIQKGRDSNQLQDSHAHARVAVITVCIEIRRKLQPPCTARSPSAPNYRTNPVGETDRFGQPGALPQLRLLLWSEAVSAAGNGAAVSGLIRAALYDPALEFSPDGGAGQGYGVRENDVLNRVEVLSFWIPLP